MDFSLIGNRLLGQAALSLVRLRPVSQGRRRAPFCQFKTIRRAEVLFLQAGVPLCDKTNVLELGKNKTKLHHPPTIHSLPFFSIEKELRQQSSMTNEHLIIALFLLFSFFSCPRLWFST